MLVIQLFSARGSLGGNKQRFYFIKPKLFNIVDYLEKEVNQIIPNALDTPLTNYGISCYKNFRV